MKKIFSLCVGILSIATLTACGGGSSEKEGAQNKITYFNVIPNQHQMVHVKAGESLPLFATVETFGPALKSIAWNASPAKGNTVGILDIDDPSCQNMEFSNREVPGSKDMNVGTGYCETFARVHEDASGQFNVFAKVTASDGTQRTEKIEVNVLPREKITYDFTLKAKSLGEVQIGQPVKLFAEMISDKPLPSSAEVDHQWTVLSKPFETASPQLNFDPTTNEASVILTAAGSYLFEVKATVKTKDQAKTKSAVVKVDLSKPIQGGYFDLKVNAKTEQPTVVVGAPSNLIANFTVKDGTILSGVNYLWKQISGPEAIITGEDRKSAYVVPSAAGTLVFEVTVSILSNSVIERESAIVTVVAENPVDPSDPSEPTK